MEPTIKLQLLKWSVYWIELIDVITGILTLGAYSTKLALPAARRLVRARQKYRGYDAR